MKSATRTMSTRLSGFNDPGRHYFVIECHAERSEESRIFNYLRLFAALRVTKKVFLK